MGWGDDAEMLPKLREIIERVKELSGDIVLVEPRYWENTVFEYHAQDQEWETHIYCTPQQCINISIDKHGARIIISPTMELDIKKQDKQPRSNTSVIIS